MIIDRISCNNVLWKFDDLHILPKTSFSVHHGSLLIHSTSISWIWIAKAKEPFFSTRFDLTESGHSKGFRLLPFVE